MRTINEVHDSITISSQEIIQSLNTIGWTKIIDAISETFVEEAHGRVTSPAKTIINFAEANNDFRIMPSYMEKYPDFCGVKIIGACGDNPKKYGLPLAIGMYVLNDKWTQRPLMIFDAAIPTAWRTAAASAVGVRELSEPTATTLGIIGCGVQAHYHIPAIMAVRNITKIIVFDLDETKIDDLAKHYNLVTKATKQEILEQADIIVTMTPTTKAHIITKDIPQRTMTICAIGGDSEKKMEFESSILGVTDHFCDSLDQVSHTGTVYTALHNNEITFKELKSLGSLMIGKQCLNPLKPIKMFLSTGVALEDLAIARLLYNYCIPKAPK